MVSNPFRKAKAADVWRGDLAYHEGKTLDSLVDHCKERNLDPRIVLAALTQVAPGDVFRRIVGGRKREYRHAALLSDVYPKIMAEHKYKNFDMAYYSFVDLLEYAIHEWTAAGGDVRDLIEPIDGFSRRWQGACLG